MSQDPGYDYAIVQLSESSFAFMTQYRSFIIIIINIGLSLRPVKSETTDLT